MCNYLWLSVITLSLNREELVQGVVDINVSEGTELLVKMEQPDPLGKSSSEYGGSEEEREELGDKASEDGSVNVSSLLGNSYDSHAGNINKAWMEIPRLWLMMRLMTVAGWLSIL